MLHRPPRLVTILSLAGLSAGMVACATPSAGDRDTPLASGQGGVYAPVNRYLWRASLDTIGFMPVIDANPVSGLIVTDWYANPQSPGERFRANVYVLDTALRADALRVAVFRQMLTTEGWMDAATNTATAQEVENAILTRARQLRLASLDG